MTRLETSEAQRNAEALARRGTAYAPEHRATVTVAHDYRLRQPANLWEAVRMARRAYADEVPSRLHEHAIGEGGTPRMTNAAEGYIFGSASADDAGRDPETGQRELYGYYRTPFRATLERFLNGGAAQSRRGRIVSHVTIGGMGAAEAALAEDAYHLDADLVALDALRCFLRSMSDVKVHPPTIDVQETTTAA